jgi:hypothetical protein
MMEHALAQAQGLMGGAALGRVPEQLRAFDGICDAVGRVRATGRQVQAMLDRISPQPRELPEVGGQNAASRQPYSIALQDLHSALNDLGSLIDSLEKFI